MAATDAETVGPPPSSYSRYEPRRPRTARWGPGAVSGAIVGLVLMLLIVVPPFVVSSSWGPIHLGPNEVTNWSNYNYQGYENQSSYSEYRSVIQTMESVSRRYGCGRAMWEYSDSENRFGTPEALMLLPYWTSGCVDSMEGLLFESSATTPYHFINQAELSQGPSEPEVGLPYGPVDVTLGVQHLQLLGVKYFMAETPEVEQQANADPSLQLVAKTGPWTYSYNGVLTHTTWEIYVVKSSSLVTPLSADPAVLSGVNPAPKGWLSQSLAWYDNPSRWKVELAQDGPSSWPRTTVGDNAAAGPAGRDDEGHRHQPDGHLGQLPRVQGGHTGVGEDLVLPQLARQRCRRAVAGHPEPDGRRPDESQRDPHLRPLFGRLPR